MMQRFRQLLLMLTVMAGVTVVTFSAPSPAQAAPKKKKAAAKKSSSKKSSKKKDDKKEEVAKPGDDEKKEEAAPGEAALKRDTAASFKVETKLDQKEIARTQQADIKRDEAIEELKKLIP